MIFAIGVDGGGTLMRAVIVDERGEEVARADAPGAVVTLAAPAAPAAAVSEAVRSAAQEASVSLPGAVLWAGLSGAGHEAARVAVLSELAGAGLAVRVHVGTDVEAAFHDAFAEAPGILLIAGTGSIAWARNEAGEVGRVGGWGRGLGDEGSGYDIGLGGLRAVVRAEDGRGERTAMRGPVLEHLGLAAAEELIPWAATASKGEVAALVPIVVRASAEGDPVAAGLLARAVADLEEHLAAILERMGPWAEKPRLVLWGGLISEGGPLQDRLTLAVAGHPVELAVAELDPSRGAARLALAALRDTTGTGR